MPVVLPVDFLTKRKVGPKSEWQYYVLANPERTAFYIGKSVNYEKRLEKHNIGSCWITRHLTIELGHKLELIYAKAGPKLTAAESNNAENALLYRVADCYPNALIYGGSFCKQGNPISGENVLFKQKEVMLARTQINFNDFPRPEWPC